MSATAVCRRALAASADGLVWLVRGYQRWISPLTGPRCRFYPSCSDYAITALRTHGLVRGGALAARRLTRCHPFNPGGVDHVPERVGLRWRGAER
ncbi:MAG: membrane protein insertion efficiency factor YidD [Bifidobacteriaceae bacterium]|nr:membrane protein insertion efficiency factor YidD [Bifidobacteriaceae bacterium]